ncbi:protein SSUH2 homolog isoform X3 [Pseudoliparis swirei]|uniref:protein SSUH2 homolog isoform X3 n=1 Tax=Pseudoliparis swirei TaxID=2059687 RepID=UPI0024BEA43E|nr:protein SSUH2 homolog isoform X3 [Pseudoliparis swirei]
MSDQDEDLGAFDPNIPEEGPTAPPAGWLDVIHGYQDHKGGDADPLYPPPPAYTPQPELNKNTLVPNVRVPMVSEAVARDALLRFVDSKWRYSSKPARNLVFKELKPITVYRYRLESFTETRTSAWQFEPYNAGQLVDGPQFGASPPPWDVPLALPPAFSDRVEKLRVPHSSLVKLCHKCNGCGRTRCGTCHGRGRKRCIYCHGYRRKRNKRCTSCNGRGHKRCTLCQGQGSRSCSVCLGTQQLLHFILLTVTWKNDVSDFIPDRQPDFPDQRFQQVSGDPYFVDASVLVYPIQGFPDQEICDVSTRLINEHLRRHRDTRRILQQRQTIELVPLTQALYTFNGKNYNYYVYGAENQVFTWTKERGSSSVPLGARQESATLYPGISCYGYKYIFIYIYIYIKLYINVLRCQSFLSGLSGLIL